VVRGRAYLYLKIWDWAATSYYSYAPGTASALARLQATTPYTQTFWWLEVVFGGIIPALIILVPVFRRNNSLLMASLAFIVMGLVINRWNVTLSGLVVPPDWSPGIMGNIFAVSYNPSIPEVAVSLGILAYGLLAFTLGVKYLRIYPGPDFEIEHHKV